MTVPISPQVGVLLFTASALSGAHARRAMVPEALLLAALYDSAIYGSAVGHVPEDGELRRQILVSDEAGDTDGWSARAREAYNRAWTRAGGRGRKRSLGGAGLTVGLGAFGVSLHPKASLTVGDLLWGLRGSGTVVDTVLRRRELDPNAFDDEDEAPLPEVRELGSTAPDALVDVIAVNDSDTPMDFVTNVFESEFGCPQLRAVWLMYAVHQRGAARVWTGPRKDAEGRVAKALEAARRAGFPFVLRCGTRA
jgi:ATP-dependent Clp protease adapter protein ClpS